MENRFFTIVRKFSTLMAALMLVVAVGLGLYAITKVAKHVDEDIKKPIVASDDYLKKLNGDENKTISDENTTQVAANNTLIHDEALKASKIVTKNLNAHSEKRIGVLGKNYFDENKVTEIFENQFAKTIIDLSDEETAMDFFQKISKDSDSVLKFYDKIAQKQVAPSDFIDWYYTQYVNKIKEEKARIEQEIIEKEEAKSQAIAMTYIAVTFFAAFISFTIILVLLRIERNTRKDEIAD